MYNFRCVRAGAAVEAHGLWPPAVIINKLYVNDCALSYTAKAWGYHIVSYTLLV